VAALATISVSPLVRGQAYSMPPALGERGRLRVAPDVGRNSISLNPDSLVTFAHRLAARPAHPDRGATL
jgi:hypothetical protein